MRVSSDVRRHERRCCPYVHARTKSDTPLNPIRLSFFTLLFAFVVSVAAADTNGVGILSVDEIRTLKPGPEWDPKVDDFTIEVRGYLREGGNLHLYATKDQALLDDITGVLVSDEGEGSLRENCSGGFVELVAKLSWMETERRASLIPIEARKLTLREDRPAEKTICWTAKK